MGRSHRSHFATYRLFARDMMKRKSPIHYFTFITTTFAYALLFVCMFFCHFRGRGLAFDDSYANSPCWLTGISMGHFRRNTPQIHSTHERCLFFSLPPLVFGFLFYMYIVCDPQTSSDFSLTSIYISWSFVILLPRL